MSKTETGKIENADSARVLRDDELDAVSGGITLCHEGFEIAVVAAPKPGSFYDALITS